MNRSVVMVAVAAAAVFAAVYWIAGRDPRAAADPVVAAAQRAEPEAANAPAPTVAPSPVRAASRTDATGRPVPPDPRLAALMVTPEDGVIEYRKGSDGRVIEEIDQDPSSLGYRKPMRQYFYSGDKVSAVITYRYHADRVEVVRANVSYKSDGSVDKYEESTSYETRK